MDDERSRDHHQNSPAETEWPVLVAAHEALRTAVLGVDPEAWDRPTPCDRWTVTQVLQHAVGDQLAYAAAITGQPGPTEDPFAPSGHLDRPAIGLLEHALLAASAAWATIDPAAAAVPTPLPHGALPALTAVGACALDAAVHGWDIATATGQPPPLDAALAESLMTVAVAIVEPLRAYGAYAPAIAPQASDDALAGLLRYLGRQPTGFRIRPDRAPAATPRAGRSR